MAGGRVSRKIISLVSVFAIVVALSGLQLVRPPAAKAADSHATAAETALNKLAGFVDALATEDQFGKPIPTLGLIPGSADGIDLPTLLEQTLVQPTGPLGGNYGDASDLESLQNALDGVNNADLGDSSGRHVTIDASRESGNGVDTLPITFTFTRTIHPGLDIKSTSQPFTFSSTGGLDVQLSLALHVDLNVRTSDDFVWLSHTESSPSLTLDALSTGFHPSSAEGAIGILGVRIKDGSSFSVAAHLAASFADPNNDGRLAFAEPDGTGGTDPGELAGDAAPSGIVTVDWASTPGAASGTLSIEADPSTVITSLPSASATVTVSAPDLSALNPVTASYAAGALDPLVAFERLTPKDLADALGQLAQLLTTVQMTHLDAPLSDNVDLPFMKGTLADVVSVNQAITAFLDTYVEQIPKSNSDPSKTVGRPLFSSIQDLLGDLDNPVGVKLPPNTTFDVNGVNYDATSGAEKLSFNLEIDRDPSSGEALDKLGEPFSSPGTDVTYTPTSFEDPHQKFDAADVVGRTVSAGSYTAAILSVDSGDPGILHLDPNPLTLPGQQAPSSYWKGATAAKPAPDPGTAYTIVAADPLTGVVQLADTLKGSSGIASANASVPVASVTPSYHVALPVVLDLSPPTSTTPQTIDNPDGSKTVVDQLPIPAQRIKLHTGVTTPLFWLDAPITTKVDADSRVGFLRVHVAGSLAACTTATFSAGPPLGCQATSGNTHLLSINLVADPPGADANHEIRLPDLFNDLTDPIDPHPENVLSAHVNGEAHAKLTLTVPGSSTFFGADHADITVDMADITHPSNVTVGGPDLSKLSNLLAFRILNGNQELEPKALFGALLNALSSVDDTFGKLASTGPLHDAMTTNIPFVGTSVQRLIGGGVTGGDGATYGDETDSTGHHHGTLTDPLIGALSEQQKALLQGRTLSAGTVSGVIQSAQGQKITLQQAWSPQPPNGTAYSIADELRGALDDLTANSADTLQDMLDRVVAKLGGTSAAHFSVDTAATPPVLHLDLDWNRGYKLTTPVRFQVDKYNLAGTEGHGSITVEVTGQISAKLRFPLSAGAISDPLGSLRIDPSSGASVKATADAGNDVYVQANVGPLAIALGDPSHPTATNFEAHAKLGVALTDTADSSPVSLGTYAGNLTASLNQGVPAVQCMNAPAVANQELAICAALPVYTTSDGGKTWNLLLDADVAGSSVKIRIPRRTDDDLTQQLDPTGTLADGTTPKIQLPSDLLSRIASAYLDLSSLDDGLLGYLKLTQQSLQLASAGGKLPLVGKDLQQGADFIGQIRAAVDAKLGSGGKPTTAGGYRSAINALGQDLAAKGILPGGFSSSTFQVDISCTTVLEPAGKPSVTPTNPDGGTTTYQYVIVASRSGDGTGDTIASVPSDPIQNVAPDQLGDADYNTITWATSTYADQYRILRRINNSGNFELVDTVTGQSTFSYVDKKTTTSPYTFVGGKPTLQSCPDIVPGDEVDGITVTTDLGSGSIDDPAAGCGVGCLHTTPLSIGMPGLSFKAVDTGDANNGVRAAVAWKLHLKFGLSRKLGFYIATQDHDPASPAGKSGPEFKVGAALDLPGHMTAQLSFINVDIAKHTGVTDPLFKGVFSVDLHDAGGPDCTALCDVKDVNDGAFIDLSKIKDLTNVTGFVRPVLSATASIDWDVKATTTAGAALPGIGAEFLLHWSWSSADNPNGADPGSGLPDLLQFKNVRIDPGTFIGGVLGDIVKQIVTVYKPVQPTLDTVQAPLPVLSDLSRAVGGGDVSIETLARTFNTLADGPDIDSFLQVLSSIRALANSLTGKCDQQGDDPDFCVVVGSFDLNRDIAKTQQNTPDLATTPGFINPIASSLPSSSPIAQLDARSPGNLQGTGANPEHPGFKFPALENSQQIFQLVLGHDVTLATFDSGPLALGFTFSQAFGPVYAPPPVNVVISGSAGVRLRIAAGFDTYGIRKAVENGKGDARVLESLYFQTTDDSGHPLPVVQFTGSIAAGAEVSAIVVKVGVAGGITLTVSFYWHDPDNDAKFRFNEFLAAALNNPICLFDVGGQLSLFVKVYITLGIDPFSTSFDFTLVNVKLLDFSLKPDCNPTPPRLGGVSGKTLYVYAGKLGTAGVRGERWGSQNKDEESWVIREKVDNGTKTVIVAGLGITHVFTQDIDTVVFDARGYQGELSVLFQNAVPDKPFDLKTIVFGGDGPDTIRTGSGPSFVDGGGGADRITTGDRPDPGAVDASAAPKAVVAGGGDDDVITTGNAQDWVAGDGALTFDHHDQTADSYDTTLADISNNDDTGDITLPDVVDPATVDHPETVGEVTGNADPALNDGADLVTVGIGGSTVWGDGGGDKIGTAQATTVADANPTNTRYTPGSNTIVGGSGSDQISSGSASDFIYTGSKEETGPDTEGSVDGLNTVDTGSGNDTVYGSRGEDDVTVHSKTTEHATIFGGGGTDILDGGDGTDKIYGGPDDDYLIAQPAGVDKKQLVQDQLGQAYKVSELPENPPTTSDKTLVGGGGSDRLYGGDGTSTLFGDHDTYFDDQNKQQNDPCVSPGPAASDPPVEHPNTGVTPGSNPPQADAKQADAADLILGGAGVDTVQAGGGGDFVSTFGSGDTVCGEGGGDTIDTGGGIDTAWAGSGNDTVYGRGDADNLYGNDGGDTIYGGGQVDTIEGNNGVDHLFGGDDADVVVGGTRLAGRADDGDFLYGDRGTDKLIGDNGTVAGDVVTVYDLPAPVDAADGGEDLVYGGDENDRAYGGLENDRVFGGKGDDYIEGNNGNDRLYGEPDQDDIIGGSSQVPAGKPTDANVTGMPDNGDFIYGGGNADVVLGDNGFILRTGTPSPLTTARYDTDAAGAPLMTPRAITPYDLGDTPAVNTSGGDLILGQSGGDVILGQGGNDRIQGNEDGDYAEGGQGTDWIEGNAGNDDLAGGSSSPFSADPAQGQKDSYDVLFGGSGDDLLLGDNAVVTRSGTPNPLTKRIGTAAAPIPGRAFTLLDLAPGSGPGGAPTRGVYGADLLSGGGGVDVVLGQDGGDQISGGADDDYAEGNGGTDHIWGDALLGESLINHPSPDWPANSEDRQDSDTPNGQDDLIGGSSTQAFRDANDTNGKGDELHGNGESDFELGDNGTIVRDIIDGDGNLLPYTADLTTAKQPLSNRVYKLRYPLDANGNPPAGAAYIRHSRPGTDATRFCAATASGSPCEPATAFGNDSMRGDAGDDFMYGQDGNDTMLGGAGNDDMYGELGNDTLYGEQGEDAMVGDRGGILDVFERGTAPLVHAVFNQVPKIDFTGKRPGTLSRNVDLLHDVDGDAFTTRPFPHDGVLEGGIDHMRGGDDHDSMHGGFGDDLMNGDSGGDSLFGDDGADVIWGGRGSTDPNNPNDRGTDDSYVDYLLGGKGATSGPSIAEALGSDILDWRPRGSYTPGTGCTTDPWPATVGDQTVDPCDWFVMTNTDDDLPAVPSTDPGYPAYFTSTVNNQHHQGIDWQYGGWDRDLLQADVADNGPNPGDRLLDWTGAYNLYTHCNAAYGGFNDVRQWSPDMQSFLTQWAWALGAGQTASDVTTSTTSAFDELALVYQADNTAHGSGSAFPSTPGHFDAPDACML